MILEQAHSFSSPHLSFLRKPFHGPAAVLGVSLGVVDEVLCNRKEQSPFLD